MQQTGVAATSYVGWCNRSRELSYVQVYMPYDVGSCHLSEHIVLHMYPGGMGVLRWYQFGSACDFIIGNYEFQWGTDKVHMQILTPVAGM